MEFKEMKLVSLPNISEKIYLDLPEECPHCSKGIEAVIQSTSKLTKFGNKFALLLSCPVCKNFFLQPYNYIIGDEIIYGEKFVYDFLPNIKVDIPEKIKIISPEFLDIYIQTLKADYYKLNKITSIGLHKSIEFLVKDYLINYKKEDQEKIKNIFLGKAIEKIDNLKIQTLAKATTWLGNDEAHYECYCIDEGEDIDTAIDDMKIFIEALLYFISLELVAVKTSDLIA